MRRFLWIASLFLVGDGLGKSVAQPPARESAAPMEEPTGELSLRTAVALALLKNPELASFSLELRAAEARQLQASLRPNPEMTFELENFGGTLPGLSESEATLSLGQLIELGGKRGARTEAARSELSVLEVEYEAARLAVASQVARRFLSALALQRFAIFSEEVVRTAEEVAASAANRVRAGAVSPAEASRAQLELANARLDRAALRTELSLSYARLSALWGSVHPRFVRLEGDLDRLTDVPPVDSLLARVVKSPDIRRWEAEGIARDKILALERSQRVPDVFLEGGFRTLRESGDNAFVLGFALPLPVLNRNQGNIRAAEVRVSQAQPQRLRAIVERQLAVAEAYSAVLIAKSRADTLRTEIIPMAVRAFQEITTGYERGRFGYLDLLETRRAWIDARREELSGLLAFHLAVADLEQLLGGSITPTEATRE